MKNQQLYKLFFNGILEYSYLVCKLPNVDHQFSKITIHTDTLNIETKLATMKFFGGLIHKPLQLSTVFQGLYQELQS